MQTVTLLHLALEGNEFTLQREAANPGKSKWRAPQPKQFYHKADLWMSHDQCPERQNIPSFKLLLLMKLQ